MAKQLSAAQQSRYCVFLNVVKRGKFILVCPRCPYRSTPQDMQLHLLTDHCSSNKNVCVWCFGNYSWPPNEKMYHLDHMETCYTLYVNEYLTETFKPIPEKFKRHQEKFWKEIVEPCEIQFQCPKCQEWILPKDYSIHYLSTHKTNAEKVCIFCDGQYEGIDIHHLKICFQTKMESTTAPPPVHLIMDLEPYCPARDFFERPNLFSDEYFHETLFQRDSEYQFSSPDHHQRVEFQDNIDLACFYLQKYLFKSQEEYWYHIIVRAGVLDQFIEVLKENQQSTTILPFFCWCDGGFPNTSLRHHRHMILVTFGDYFFKSQWKKILYKRNNDNDDDDSPPPPNMKCKLAKQFKGPLHLINTIVYLSKRESQCKFTKKGLENVTKFTTQQNHYYIGKSLPKITRVCMTMCYSKGLDDYLAQQFGHVSNLKLIDKAIRIDGRGKWKIPAIELFNSAEKGIVLPVKCQWKPTTTEETTHFLWGMNGTKLYFETTTTEHHNIQQQQQQQQQEAGGNVFYKIFNHLWTLPPSKQKELTVMFKYACKKDRKNNQLREKINELKTSMNTMKIAMENEIKKLQDELLKFKNKNQYRQFKRVKRENENLQEQLKQAKINIDTLYQQASNSSQEMKQEIERLQQEIHRLNQLMEKINSDFIPAADS